MYRSEQEGGGDAAGTEISPLLTEVCSCGGAAPAAGALQVFLKGVEVFSPFGHVSPLGYGLTDRYAEDQEVFSQPLEAVVSWKKELLWSLSLLAVWQSTLGSAQIESKISSCL